jgi:hypothetical protein
MCKSTSYLPRALWKRLWKERYREVVQESAGVPHLSEGLTGEQLPLGTHTRVMMI